MRDEFSLLNDFIPSFSAHYEEFQPQNPAVSSVALKDRAQESRKGVWNIPFKYVKDTTPS